MANSIEKTGRTVNEAVQAALDELKVGESSVDIEVIDEGNKGIFGIIGNKMARVRVTLKESGAEKARQFLVSVFEKMELDAEVVVEEDEESIMLRVYGKDIGIVIGRRGETLDSLQYLASLVVNKNKGSYKKVVIDVENYRQKREETLVKLAHRLADRVVKYKKNIVLEPMNPYERRIIHSSLQDNRYVETYSIGEEPNRKVVIALK